MAQVRTGALSGFFLPLQQKYRFGVGMLAPKSAIHPLPGTLITLLRSAFNRNTVHLRPSFPRKRESRDGGFEATFLDSRLRGNDEIMGLCAYLNCIAFNRDFQVQN